MEELKVVRKMTTPITYYGGKQMMVKHILPRIPELLTKYAKQYKWKMVDLELNRSAGGGRKVEVLTMNY